MTTTFPRGIHAAKQLEPANARVKPEIADKNCIAPTLQLARNALPACGYRIWRMEVRTEMT